MEEIKKLVKVKDIDNIDINNEEKQKLISKIEKYINENLNLNYIMKEIVDKQIENLANYGKLCPANHLAARLVNGLVFYSNEKLKLEWNADSITINAIEIKGDYIKVSLATPAYKFNIWAEYCPKRFGTLEILEYDDEELKYIGPNNYEMYKKIKEIYLYGLLENADKILTLTRKRLEEMYEMYEREMKERLKEEIIQELTNKQEEELEEEELEEEELEEIQDP